MLHCAFLPLESNSNKSIFVWAGECLESHLWAGSVVVGWQCGSETLKGASYICLRRRLSGVTPLRWSRSRRMTMRLGDPESGLFSYSCLRLRLFKVVPLRWICSCRLTMRTFEWSRNHRTAMRLGNPESGFFSYICLSRRVFGPLHLLN